MANPSIVPCPKDAWTKVATNVLIGYVWLAKKGADYFHTYRLTGDAAPANDSEAVHIDFEDKGIPINSSVGIDVYIKCKTNAGLVRVDL